MASNFVGIAKRFLLFGAINTVISYSIFIGLGLLISPLIAHVIGYLVGLVLVASLSNRFIFQGSGSWKRSSVYVAWYLLLMLIGQSVVWAVSPEGLNQLLITAGLLISVTVPLNVFAGMTIFKKEDLNS